MKLVNFVCVKTVVETVELEIPDDADPAQFGDDALRIASFDDRFGNASYEVVETNITEEGL